MPKSASLRDHPSVNLLFFDEISLILIDPAVNNSVGHYPNTALFNFNNPKKKIPEQGSGLSSLGRIIRTHKVCVVVCGVPLFLPKSGTFSRGAAPPNAPSTAHGARSAAATELRQSRCCDGDAQTSSVALILRVASTTQLMLLRRS